MKSVASVEKKKGFSEWGRHTQRNLLGNTDHTDVL